MILLGAKIVHHEGTKDTEFSDFFYSSLRELRAFVVKLLLPNFAFFAYFAVNSPHLNASTYCPPSSP